MADVRFQDGRLVGDVCGHLSVPQLHGLVPSFVLPRSRSDNAKRLALYRHLASFSDLRQSFLIRSIDGLEGQAPAAPSMSTKKSLPMPSPLTCPFTPTSVDDVLQSDFMTDKSAVHKDARLSAFIDRTSNDAIRQDTCACCARLGFAFDHTTHTFDTLPNKHRLLPLEAHEAQVLHHGLLLYSPSISASGAFPVCSSCIACLSKDQTPRLALVNNMWLGDVPLCLQVLTLPERILIARHFVSTHIVKLYPKGNAKYWMDQDSVNSGLRGNVSSYTMDTDAISQSIVDDLSYPRPLHVLAATIGVTFVGPRGLPERTLPNYFNVSRTRVREALLWLKSHNPFYHHITISEERLACLPNDSVPDVLFDVTKWSTDTGRLAAESAGYVPSTELDDALAGAADSGLSIDPCMANEEGSQTQATGFEMRSTGVVDLDGTSVTDSELLAHALANSVPVTTDYRVHRGSDFVNEYPRVDELTNERGIGPVDNPNHLLGAFPDLFPYGCGGFETNRPLKVTYEEHARWALGYADGRFRRNVHFIFQVFGVLQKRAVCASASLQIRKPTFQAHEHAIRSLTSKDIRLASQEEANKKPFSNPTIQLLHRHLSAVRSRVTGTDESRMQIRPIIWGTNLRFGVPTFWITVNPSDTQDPIVQVLSGVDIDLTNFDPANGPNSSERAIRVAADPFAASSFFRLMVQCVVEELFGLRGCFGTGSLKREDGIFGFVNAVVAAYEAQGRGTLHMHLVMWMRGAPPVHVMQNALKSAAFRERVTTFIRNNIHADFNNREETLSIARAVQVHKCDKGKCMVPRGKRLLCKRRAPWDVADDAWVEENGKWGPKRRYGMVNNWNPVILKALRSNHDFKWISSGSLTDCITWYISAYAGKKQGNSYNWSALLAQSYAFHGHDGRLPAETSLNAFTNQKLLASCSNALSRQKEFSAPEVVNYIMGWGDRLLSHYYVPIYWFTMEKALRNTFPGLNSFDNGRMGSTMEPVDQSEHSNATFETLKPVGSELVLKDHLRDYSLRGDDLDNYSFFQFTVDTYDCWEAPMHESDNHLSKKQSLRVPYKGWLGKGQRLRVVRRAGHETLVRVVGSWFPRNDDPPTRELYCASMLMLFKPWRKLEDLKSDDASFDEAFVGWYKMRATNDVKTVIGNIQYFHQCAASAQEDRRNQAAQEGLALPLRDSTVALARDIDQSAEIGASDQFMDLQEPSETSIEDARVNRCSMDTSLFAAQALATARNLGIFYPQNLPDTVNECKVASWEDLPTFERYNESSLSSLVQVHPSPISSSILTDDGTIGLRSTALEEPVTLSNATTVSTSFRTHDQYTMLNTEQARAHDIILDFFLASRHGHTSEQLLMQVQGEGGTGKTALLRAVTESFRLLGVPNALAKTGLTGAAASLIQGTTTHRWAGIDRFLKWSHNEKTLVGKRRIENFSQVAILVIDEVSMMQKPFLAALEACLTFVRRVRGFDTTSRPFGGISIVLFGDFHQFPPVSAVSQALYVPISPSKTTSSSSVRGAELFQLFRTVVTLRTQIRVTDPVWSSILRNLRIGACTASDISECRKLVLSRPECQVPDFTTSPWKDAVLITTRNEVRNRWNDAAVLRHCRSTSNILYICQANDVLVKDAEMDPYQRIAIAKMSEDECQGLYDRIQLAVGMQVMVLANIATDADLANGTRGIVEQIFLHPAECSSVVDGTRVLSHLPVLVYVRPHQPTSIRIPGVPEGLLPVCCISRDFDVSFENPKKRKADGTLKYSKTKVTRTQLPITPAFAFTDYKSQGQTLEHVIVDMAVPNRGTLSPFNAYVALSRSRGRNSVRLLRDFDIKLLTNHPSPALQAYMDQLKGDTHQTTSDFEARKLPWYPQGASTV